MSQVKVSGKVRVLRVLRQQGTTHQGEWSHPADGMKPIWRLSARIDELRNDGHDIPPAETIEGLAFGVYRLKRENSLAETTRDLDRWLALVQGTVRRLSAEVPDGDPALSATTSRSLSTDEQHAETTVAEQSALFNLRPSTSAYAEVDS
jgi:hypothetical protein